MDSTPKGLNLDWDSTPNEFNPDWDSTPKGLNPNRDSTPNGLNSEWDSTSNSSQPQIALFHRLNIKILLFSLNMNESVIYQKNGFKKRIK
jgi:hypothetical protein